MKSSHALSLLTLAAVATTAHAQYYAQPLEHPWYIEVGPYFATNNNNSLSGDVGISVGFGYNYKLSQNFAIGLEARGSGLSPNNLGYDGSVSLNSGSITFTALGNDPKDPFVGGSIGLSQGQIYSGPYIFSSASAMVESVFVGLPVARQTYLKLAYQFGSVSGFNAVIFEVGYKF